MIKKDKRGDFSFVWLFAIIAGSAILFLAIYGAVRWGKTSSQTQDSEIAKELTVITDSLQAGFASARKSTISSSKEIILEEYCSSDSFGSSEISVMTLDRASKEFESFGVSVKTTNKYLFVSDKAGKKFNVFSVPIEFAFKIADAIIIDAQEYCFIGMEDESQLEDIRAGLGILGEKALFGSMNCTENSIRVCFGVGGDCDVIVRPDCSNSYVCENAYEVGTVEKDGTRVSYVGNLVYPAIFASEEGYLCNLRRLLYRQSILANLYNQKISSFSSRSCSSSVGPDLEVIEEISFELSRNFNDRGLVELYFQSKITKEDEEMGQCKVWS